jgi:hypothetical protein
VRRAFLLATGLAVAALLAACGSESNPQADAVTQTYETYIAAVQSSNGRLACRQLTPAYARKAARQVPPPLQAKLKGASCPEVIRVATPAAIKNFEPNLTGVEINGDRASGSDPGEGVFGPQKVLFHRLGGEWKIAGTIYSKNGP